MLPLSGAFWFHSLSILCCLSHCRRCFITIGLWWSCITLPLSGAFWFHSLYILCCLSHCRRCFITIGLWWSCITLPLSGAFWFHSLYILCCLSDCRRCFITIGLCWSPITLPLPGAFCSVTPGSTGSSTWTRLSSNGFASWWWRPYWPLISRDILSFWLNSMPR